MSFDIIISVCRPRTLQFWAYYLPSHFHLIHTNVAVRNSASQLWLRHSDSQTQPSVPVVKGLMNSFWKFDFVLHFNNVLFKWIMQNVKWNLIQYYNLELINVTSMRENLTELPLCINIWFLHFIFCVHRFWKLHTVLILHKALWHLLTCFRLFGAGAVLFKISFQKFHF